MDVVDRIGISQDGIQSLDMSALILPAEKTTHRRNLAGELHILCDSELSLSSGQSKSTFLICSHRSTVCLMRVMMLYLT